MSEPAIPATRRNLPLMLLQARERVMSRFRPFLNANGLTEQQWRVMRALHTAGSLEPREIGEQCCISSPSMAGILARMQDLQFVDRQRMETDQRRVRVSLTRRGRTLVEQLTPLSEAAYRQLEAELGHDEVARLYEQLDHLLAALRPGEGDSDG